MGVASALIGIVIPVVGSCSRHRPQRRTADGTKNPLSPDASATVSIYPFGYETFTVLESLGIRIVVAVASMLVGHP